MESNGSLQKEEHVHVDRISNLPCDIIIFIISRLTLREATATSILSSRWRNLHTYTARLDIPPLNEYLVSSNKNNKGILIDADLVNHVLDSHRGTRIQELKVETSGSGAERFYKKWFEFALAREAQVVHMKVASGNCLFGQLSTEILVHGLTRLKELTLSMIGLTDRDFDLLVNRCPVLESLSVEFPMILMNAQIIGQTRLKHLDLSFVWELRSLVIRDATSLVSLRLYELGNGCSVQFGNIPKLSDLEFGEGRSRFQHASFFVAIPFYLHDQLRSLHLSTINGDACRGDIGPFVKFVNVKNMELVIQMQEPIYSYYYRHCLYRLIAACTSLEKLVIKFSWRLADDLELKKKDSRRSPVRMNEGIYATCLKELEIEGYLGSRSESRLCSDMIGHAKALKKLIVVPCGLNNTVREASLARAHRDFRHVSPSPEFI